MAASSSGPPVASGNKRGAAYEDDRVFKRFKSGDDMDSMLDSALVPFYKSIVLFLNIFFNFNMIKTFVISIVFSAIELIGLNLSNTTVFNSGANGFDEGSARRA